MALWDLAIALAWLAAIVPSAECHSFIWEPKARQLVAFEQSQMYCPHCMQAGGPTTVKSRAGGTWPSNDKPESHGLCGDPVQGGEVKSNWRDETYLQPTPVQATYEAGSVVEFTIGVSTHHNGHYEWRICDKTISPNTISSPADGYACLNKWVLERAPLKSSCTVNSADADCQPIDPDQPHRWFLPPQASRLAARNVSVKNAPEPPVSEVHKMRYKIPQGLNCSQCTLQWYWATGNTCLYDGLYFSYFDKMRSAGWSNTQSWCQFCNPGNTCDGTCCGSPSGKYPEEFWNCADIAVTGGGSLPTPTPPTPTPLTPTPTPPSPIPGCMDNHVDCAYWADIGECETNPGWMLVNCPVMCGSCPTPVPTPVPTPAPTPQPTPAPTQPTPTPVCVDNHPDCAIWAGMGECEANPGWMLDNCPASCDSCQPVPTPAPAPPPSPPTPAPTPCVDTHVDCAYWANLGECEANPGYMLANCPLACGSCGSGGAASLLSGYAAHKARRSENMRYAAYKAWHSKRSGYDVYKAWRAGMLARSGDL